MHQNAFNYVSLGLLPIKNIDLPEKLKRNTVKSHAIKNKKKLGGFIEEHPESVEIKCCADSFQRVSRSVLIQPKIFAILPIV